MSLTKAVKKSAKKSEPVWKGPESKSPNGGVTQSLLGKFLVCRERFRIYTIEGLKGEDRFNHRLEFGNLWHEAEDAYASGDDWKEVVKEKAKELLEKYPFQQEQVSKWYQAVLYQFPVYIDYWKSNNKGKKKIVPITQEEEFQVPYELPSGRVVYLRGKWDSIEKVGSKIWLRENKTKGDIDESKITRQLNFDLQTMFYLVALYFYLSESKRKNLTGVIYNVIRRPFSGGKGSIRQKKPTKANPKGESEPEFFNRLINDYIAKEPEEWFTRWTVEITLGDMERFRREFLDPILECLCDWYFTNTQEVDRFNATIEYNGGHYRMPYGVYNAINEGGESDVDNYLMTGNKVGLQKVDDLFPELG